MRISDWNSDVCSSDLQCKENRQQCPVQRNCNRQKSDNRINEPDKDEIAPPVHEILPSLAQRYLHIPNTDCAYPDLRNAPIHMRIMRSAHIALLMRSEERRVGNERFSKLLSAGSPHNPKKTN